MVFRLVKLVVALLIVLAIAWVGKRFMEAWNESAGASPASAAPIPASAAASPASAAGPSASSGSATPMVGAVVYM